MSKVLNMVGGGGGKNISSIIITGLLSTNTVTCIKDGKSYIATWDDTARHWEIVGLPLGTFTVTATNGTRTTTETVLIDISGVYEIEMSLKVWLYKDGNPCTEITGGWKKTGNIPSSIIFNDDHIYWSHAEGANVDSAVVTENLIDFSGFTKLRFEVAYDGIKYWCRCGYGADQSHYSFTSYVELNGSNTSNIIKDVSLENVGQVYPKVFFGAGVTYLKIHKIWLE